MSCKEILINLIIGIIAGLISGAISSYVVSEVFYNKNKEEQFAKDKNNLISYLIKLLYLDNENTKIEDVKIYLTSMPDYGEFNGYTTNNKQLFMDLYCNIDKIKNAGSMTQFKDSVNDLGEIIIKLQMSKYQRL